MRGWIRWFGATATSSTLLVPGCGERSADRQAATSASKTILVDNIHSPARDEVVPLGRGDFRYLALHGMGRFFDHLAANGYVTRYVTRADAAELSPKVLRDVDILFVDLLALHCLDYTRREIDVVRTWVDHGGALLVAADHTNVYDNARRANALLEPLGIRIQYSTAIDRVPEFANPEGSYLKVRKFGAHPITRGVRAITYMGGATLATDHGVAFLSADGFSDSWTENRPPRHLGNWKRDPGEPAGSLPLIAARAHGRGRVVVLGDENIPGNQQLFMADNFELLANLFAWLGGDDVSTSTLRRLPAARLRVGFDLESAQWNVYGNDCDFYHPFYITFNQTPGVIARGLLDLEGSWDVLVFTDPSIPLGPAALQRVRAHLAAGGTVVVSTDVTRTRPGARALLMELLPEVRVRGRREIDLRDLPAAEDVDTVGGDEEWPAVSDHLQVAGLRIGGHGYPGGLRCPWDVEKAKPYLHRIEATGGQPLLQAQLGDARADIARFYSVGGGTVVVFFQDGLFRNETLGVAEHIPTGRTVDAFRVAYAFVDWLLARHGGTTAGRVTGEARP